MSAASEPAEDIVVFMNAKSPFEAKIVQSVLEGAGVRAFVPGGMLTDEFAMSQRLMNLQTVEIRVHKDQLSLAREALQAAREAGEAMAAEGDEDAGTAAPE